MISLIDVLFKHFKDAMVENIQIMCLQGIEKNIDEQIYLRVQWTLCSNLIMPLQQERFVER